MNFVEKIREFFSKSSIEMSTAYITSSLGVIVSEGEQIAFVISTLLLTFNTIYKTIAEARKEARRIELDSLYEIKKLDKEYEMRLKELDAVAN